MSDRSPSAPSPSAPSTPRPDPDPAVVCESVSREYRRGRDGGTRVVALDGVSLSVTPGTFLAVTGPSGSGKSTLLHLLAALDTPSSGRVLLAGTDTAAVSERRRTRLRLDHVGVVFQRFHLLPSLSARSNVALPLIERGVPKRDRHERAEDLLARVGLGDRVDHRPGELSGGEQQRVAVARALVSGPAVAGTDAAYRIVPGGSAQSAVTAVEGQRLGRVHPTSERIEGLDGVERATPVLFTLTRIETDEAAPYVLVVGVVARPEGTVAGLPTDGLTPGDPFYANGSYDGPWTGEAVLSTSASRVLDASEGDPVALDGARAAAAGGLRVTRVAEPASSGIGQFPVVLVHLAELQSVTGAAETDSADQILVRATPGAGVREQLAGVYPNSEVFAEGGLLRQRAVDSRLPVAVAVAGLVVGVVVGALVVATALGFELLADAPQRAVMAAVGLSRRSRLLLVAVQGLTVTVAGGLVGIGLWLVGVGLANLVSTRLLDGGIVARLHPAIGAYGVGVALLVALLAVPYLLVLGGRTNVLDRLEGQ